MKTKGNILAVDDTPASLRLLTEILTSEGYSVRSAINGELAIQAALARPPELILLDVNMPDIDGFEVCQRMKVDQRLAGIPVIFISALSEMPEKLRGFDLGGVDYITKPFHREELVARVKTHLELNQLRNHLEEMVERRTLSLIESEKRLKKSLIDSITAVAATIERRDPYTAGHQRRVARLAVAIARELELTDGQIEGLNLASVAHDVGKISIPAEILSKPGELMESEIALIKEHPVTGYEILKEIEFPWPVAQIVLQHHERLDGSGYPGGLRGKDILIEARILAVSDVVEAMASHRPYRPAIGIEAGLQEVTKKKGVLYDSRAVDACVALFNTKSFSFD